MEKLLLKQSEVSEITGWCRTTVYDLIRRGEMPGVVRVGRSVRISAEALREWVREQAERQAN